MEKELTTSIHSIAINSASHTMQWRVNQTINLGDNVGKGRISSIKEDTVHQMYNNVRAFIITVTPENKDYYEFVWKRVENMPVEITFSALKRI